MVKGGGGEKRKGSQKKKKWDRYPQHHRCKSAKQRQGKVKKGRKKGGGKTHFCRRNVLGTEK